MTAPFVIGYSKAGSVELGRCFASLNAARRWAKFFARDFDTVAIYDGGNGGELVETVVAN